MKIALEVFGSLLVLLSLLPLIKTYLWWVRIFDFPRTQLALFISLTLGSYLWFYFPDHTLTYLFAFGLVGALAIQLFFILPFTRVHRVEALVSESGLRDNALTIMIANVRMSNKAYGAFLKLVRQADPDLLIINEPNRTWAKEIAELDQRYPYYVKHPLENTYGMMLYSRLELLNHQIKFLVEEGIPSFHCDFRLPGGQVFDLFTVHPQPPRFMKNTDAREAELLQVGRLAKKTPHPSIVAGDLNDVAWSHTTRLFKRISGLIDPRIGRGLYSTYNALLPFFRYPLDHVFYDPAFRLLEIKRLPKFGSDHFPILISLNYEPQGEIEQEHPTADAEDHQEANQMIREGKNPD